MVDILIIPTEIYFLLAFKLKYKSAGIDVILKYNDTF